MIRRPPVATSTHTLIPFPTLCRSMFGVAASLAGAEEREVRTALQLAADWSCITRLLPRATRFRFAALPANRGSMLIEIGSCPATGRRENGLNQCTKWGGQKIGRAHV